MRQFSARLASAFEVSVHSKTGDAGRLPSGEVSSIPMLEDCVLSLGLKAGLFCTSGWEVGCGYFINSAGVYCDSHEEVDRDALYNTYRYIPDCFSSWFVFGFGNESIFVDPGRSYR